MAPVPSVHAASDSSSSASKTVKAKRVTVRTVKRSSAKSSSGKRKVISTSAKRSNVVRAQSRPTFARLAGLQATPDPLDLGSSVAFVQDLSNSHVLFAKNQAAVLPIASITKLMTAVVTLEARQPLDEVVEVTSEDVDYERNSRSRLAVGSRLSRQDMLHLALMSSENRAAHALGRNYPGGLNSFVAAMNLKAKMLGMFDSHFVDPTGLSNQNVSSAQDLARLLRAAYDKDLIQQFSTDAGYSLVINGRTQQFHNTNQLVSKPDWDIAVSKTGFINEAGKCLVMLARIEGKPMAIVLLDASDKFARTADAQRLRSWLERANVL